jgi:lipopolysaccharide transport system ATP-binding protein
MSNVAIRVDGLSKLYTLGANQQPYRTLRESITSAAKWPVKALRGAGAPKKGPEHEPDLWALKDVSFEIKKGEVVGIIGRNGAGKSTLLKVLSRITEPTSGYADLRGRVGTLLEVGTGFHPELTGRENIQLSGAILGMTRSEILRRFDEIVAFAEVERFVDTPVKFYSTGMFLRLAFAVAAHLEPEILFVDEVLAVGDMAFQQKCLGKMGEAAKNGRTVLFVSHNMGAIRSLCERGLVLHKGQVVESGDISQSIETYFRLSSVADQATEARIAAGGTGFGPVKVASHPSSTVDQSEAFEVATTAQFREPVAGFNLYCIVNDMHQRKMFQQTQDSSEFQRGEMWQGLYDIRVKLPALWLEPGLYSLHFKMFVRTEAQSARYISDTLHLDISGRSAGCGSILNPQAGWSLETASKEQGAVYAER